MESVSKTLTINVSLGHSHRRMPASPVAPRPVSHVFAETNIKENNLEYQQLLIKNKELELGMGELKAELNRLQKQRKKGDKLVEEASQRRALAGIQLKEKQCYLQRYHDGLDRKFRGGRDDLFAGLKKLEQNLLEMYQRDERRINESLQPEREEFKRVQALVDIQRSQREMLLQEVTALERMRNINSPNGHPTNEREELQAQNQFVKAEIERLTKQKKNLEGEERILKKILNVEEEHKRHGVIIAAGIRKMFSIKVKDQRYKEATAQEYSKNLSGLSDILSQRKAEHKTHLAEYEEKKNQLSELREENALKNKEYSELEDELFSQKPK